MVASTTQPVGTRYYLRIRSVDVAGKAYIYYGEASMNNEADVELIGAATGDYFSRSVSSTGDLNSDGYNDIIVGAYGNDEGGSGAGKAYIYYGGASVNNEPDVEMIGEAASDLFGYSVD